MCYNGAMDRIFLAINAKVNLSLDVVGNRTDGYHELDMCLASVGVADKIDCALCDCISVSMDGKICGAENIAYRAADECVKAGIIQGLDINIIKGIPLSSGMGGSSADCAGVLFAVQTLTGCEEPKLLKIAEKLASDAVFMYYGGFARARGKGDNLQFLPFKKLYVTIAQGGHGALTKDVFKAFDNGGGHATSHTERCVGSLSGDELILGNGLTTAAINVCGEINNTLKLLEKYSDRVCMTGSGSACFAVFDTFLQAEKCRDAITKHVDYAIATTTCERGVEIVKG